MIIPVEPHWRLIQGAVAEEQLSFRQTDSNAGGTYHGFQAYIICRVRLAAGAVLPVPGHYFCGACTHAGDRHPVHSRLRLHAPYLSRGSNHHDPLQAGNDGRVKGHLRIPSDRARA